MKSITDALSRTRAGVRSSWRWLLHVVGVLAVLSAVLVGTSASVAANSHRVTEEARVAARKLPDGRVEFALQVRPSAEASWGSRLLPDTRFFPPEASVGRWLRSSHLTDGERDLRVVARKLADWRIEFALQVRPCGGEWGDRLLPATRLFPPDAEIDRWLRSSPVQVTSGIADSTPDDSFVHISGDWWELRGGRFPTIAASAERWEYQTDTPCDTAPTLFVTCRNNTLGVEVWWDTTLHPNPLDDLIPVGVALDGGDPVIQSWYPDTGGKAWMHSPQPAGFVFAALSASEILIAVAARPYRDNPAGAAAAFNAGDALRAALPRLPCW